jgi:hypothetical protein
VWSSELADVCDWHKADMARGALDVRYWGKADVTRTQCDVRFLAQSSHLPVLIGGEYINLRIGEDEPLCENRGKIARNALSDVRVLAAKAIEFFDP